MPAEIQQATLTAALVRFFGVKGRYRPQLDEVVVPVYPVAAASQPEYPGYVAFIQCDSGATGSKVALSNNARSGQDFVVSKVEMWRSFASADSLMGLFLLNVATGFAANTAGSGFITPMQSAFGAPVTGPGTLRFTTGVVTPLSAGLIGRFPWRASPDSNMQRVVFDSPGIIRPGGSLIVNGEQPGQQFAAIYYTARPLTR